MQDERVRIWQGRGFAALLVTHDVEEALLLANRVIVVNARAGRALIGGEAGALAQGGVAVQMRFEP